MRLRSNLNHAEASTSYLPRSQAAVSCPLWPTPTSQLRSQAKQRQAVLGRAVHASAALAATLERPTAGREELNSGSPSQAAEALAPDVTTVNTGMAVTWLGTSSGSPTRTRNVSSIALRLPKETMLVDCGEATARQIVVAGIEPASITNIFITHLHGDHCFGLMGIVEHISKARRATRSTEALRIFGPPGVQYLLKTSVGFTDSQLAMPLIVGEWTIDPQGAYPPTEDPNLPGLFCARIAPDIDCRPESKTPPCSPSDDEDEEHSNADDNSGLDLKVPLIPGLRWTVPCSQGFKVTAAQLRHRMPCWGYVFKEASTPPRERLDRVQSVGLQPGVAEGLLRRGHKPRSEVMTPSGQPVMLGSLFSPPVPGRKVVLLGDTCDSSSIEEAAFGADLVSHEATFDAQAWQKARKAQHSTATMAGAFGRKIQAEWLFLTHFSGRYGQAQNPANASFQNNSFTKSSDDATLTTISGLRDEACRAMGSHNVSCVQDFFTCEVKRKTRENASRGREVQQPSVDNRAMVAEDPLAESGHINGGFREGRRMGFRNADGAYHQRGRGRGGGARGQGARYGGRGGPAGRGQGRGSVYQQSRRGRGVAEYRAEGAGFRSERPRQGNSAPQCEDLDF